MNLLVSLQIKIFFSFLLFFHFSYALEFTKEEKAWIAAHPVVKLGSDYSWAPYDFVDKEGRHSGIASDFLALVSQKSGLTFDVKTGVWSEILSSMKKGDFDGLSCAVSTPEREEYLHFSMPYVSMPLAIIVQENREDIQTIDDLSGKVVSVNKGSYLHEWLVLNHPEIKLKLTSSNNASLEAVSFSEVDAYIGNIAVATYIMKTHYLSNLKIVNRIHGMNTEVSIAIAKDNSILQAIIEKILTSISHEERKNIIERWFAYSQAENNTMQLTEKEKAWIASHPLVTVGIDKTWEPFDFVNDEGKHDGMSADYLRLISKKTGLHFVIEKHEKWSDVLEAAQKKQLDMLSALAPSKERAKYLNFTEPYMRYAFVLASADTNSFFYDIADFNGKRVGVIESYITEDILKENYPNIEVVTYDNLEELLSAIASHEIDAAFDNAVSMAYHIKKEGYAHIKMVSIGEYKRSITMGVTQGNELLLSILNKALKSIGTADKNKIREKWVSFKYEKIMDYTLVYQILGLFLFFILGTWYWYGKLNREVKKRKASEEQMSMMIDTIPLNVIVSGLDGSVLRANAFSLKTFSVKAEDIYGHNVMEFYVNTEERDDIIKTIQEEGKVSKRIVKFKRFDNTQMDIMISIIPILYDEKKALLSIMVDLTERVEMEENLRDAKEIATLANKSKSDFLANMSHEIRTPMNAIMGFTELLNNEIKEPRHKGYIKTIKNAGTTLLTLINDILDLSKIEAGKLDINKRAINLYDLSEEVLSIFMMSVREKDLDLLIDIDENVPKSLLLDDTRLRQVLVNLIGNAVKFTEAGYIKLKISVLSVDEHHSKLDLNIVIEDTGIGIPRDQLENIFHSFEQKTGQDNRKFGGTGLGLTISKRLTEMMGGTIQVESNESKGSKFSLHFYNVDVSSIEVENKSDEAQLHAENIVFEPAKILVVDDIEDNIELVVQSFEGTLLKVITAANGHEGVTRYKHEKPDLILMDIRMPVMDGYEAAKQIKAMDNTVPIVALTASVMQDEYERSRSKNFDAYLRKPVLRDALYRVLSHFLEHKTVPTEEKKEEKVSFNIDKNVTLNVAKIVEEMHRDITPLHEKSDKSNNIEEIKQFSSKVHALADKYAVDVLEEYALKLDEAIETFDISQMKILLKEYGILQEKFELL